MNVWSIEDVSVCLPLGCISEQVTDFRRNGILPFYSSRPNSEAQATEWTSFPYCRARIYFTRIYNR
jgi:hypothetical protein